MSPPPPRLSALVSLVSEGLEMGHSPDGERRDFGERLKTAIASFTVDFLPHMKEEEEVHIHMYIYLYMYTMYMYVYMSVQYEKCNDVHDCCVSCVVFVYRCFFHYWCSIFLSQS